MSRVLLLTHGGDFFTIDRVAEAVTRHGGTPYRLDTDRFPAQLRLSAVIRDGTLRATLRDGDRVIELDTVTAVWMRRLWSAGHLDGLDPRWHATSRHQARTALSQLLPLLPHARWLDPLDRQLAAESKPRQLLLAARLGLRVPDTVIGNDPAAVRSFATDSDRPLITKLLEPIAYGMQGRPGRFAYTSRLHPEDLDRLQPLRWVPQIFQPEVAKARELRVVFVGDECFAGAIDPRGTGRGEVDWRQLRPDEGPSWQPAQLPDPVRRAARALLDELGLHFGALDFIVTPDDEHVFLEVNPAGEWGWLERDLGLPISDAIGHWLVHAKSRPARARPPAADTTVVPDPPAPPRAAPLDAEGTATVPWDVEPRRAPAVQPASDARPAVLIITHSGDNECIATVSAAIEQRGGRPIRFDTDRYPTAVGLSTLQGRSGSGLVVANGERVPIESLHAVWYRRFAAGGRLPPSLGDTREAAVGETRRTLHGAIANLPCFQLDPLAAVQRTHHKELQLRLAAELGLDVPRTLVTNRAEDAREFWHRLQGRVVTKMQHSFAIYRQGRENVVFTTRVAQKDLDAMDGLRLCPMTFQEELTKAVELRVTIVGQRVMSASVDSAARARTEVDWRRDGIGLMNQWQPYELPAAVERKLLALQRALGLNYGAADFIVTPKGRHVFLEVNPVGEFFWLDRDPGLPISDTLAAVLLDQAPRNVTRLGG